MLCRFLVLGAALSAVGLSGCAGPVETHIASSGPGLTDRPPLMWAAEAAPAAEPAVRAALTAQGFRFAEDAPVAVVASLSERPAALGVQAMQGGAEAAVLAPGKRPRLLQDCTDRSLRLTLSLVDRATGRLLYRASAQEAHCHATLAEVTPRLARMAAADLANPGTARLVLSRGRD